MTAEEALHICKLATKCAMFDQQCTDMTEFIDAMKQKYDLEVMVDCIQKQIPKKPNYEREQTSPFGEDDVPCCPRCNLSLPESVNHCQMRGQKILWEDE